MAVEEGPKLTGCHQGLVDLPKRVGIEKGPLDPGPVEMRPHIDHSHEGGVLTASQERLGFPGLGKGVLDLFHALERAQRGRPLPAEGGSRFPPEKTQNAGKL